MYRIAVIPGDGTGPEVVREGLKVLEAVAAADGFKYETADFDLGGDRYLRTGETLPESVLDELRGFDAIYLGAIGHPDVAPGILEKGILLRLRFELDQYINLRPVKLYPGVGRPLKDKGPEDIDFVVVRENTEGLYGGMGGFQYKGTPHEVSTQDPLHTRFGAERCHPLRLRADPQAQQEEEAAPGGQDQRADLRPRHLVARVQRGRRGDYPDIKRDYAHVDATCMWFVKNPEWFDVIVMDNMFGDIITDLGAMIQGGMGIAAGGNINPQGVSMFEPIGGSAPKYTGQNVINPLAAICAAQMMVDEPGRGARPPSAWSGPIIAALTERQDQVAQRRPDGHEHLRGGRPGGVAGVRHEDSRRM